MARRKIKKAMGNYQHPVRERKSVVRYSEEYQTTVLILAKHQYIFARRKIKKNKRKSKKAIFESKKKSKNNNNDVNDIVLSDSEDDDSTGTINLVDDNDFVNTDDIMIVDPPSKSTSAAAISTINSSSSSSSRSSTKGGTSATTTTAVAVAASSSSSSSSGVAYFASATATGDNDDEEVQAIGEKNVMRLPHLRQHCTECKFVEDVSKSREKVYQGVQLNSKTCELCYCYICDKPASECKQWGGTPSQLNREDHCNASDKGDSALFYKSLRDAAKKGTATDNNKPKSKKTNHVLAAASTSGVVPTSIAPGVTVPGIPPPPPPQTKVPRKNNTIQSIAVENSTLSTIGGVNMGIGTMNSNPNNYAGVGVSGNNNHNSAAMSMVMLQQSSPQDPCGGAMSGVPDIQVQASSSGNSLNSNHKLLVSSHIHGGASDLTNLAPGIPLYAGNPKPLQMQQQHHSQFSHLLHDFVESLYETRRDETPSHIRGSGVGTAPNSGQYNNNKHGMLNQGHNQNQQNNYRNGGGCRDNRRGGSGSDHNKSRRGGSGSRRSDDRYSSRGKSHSSSHSRSIDSYDDDRGYHRRHSRHRRRGDSDDSRSPSIDRDRSKGRRNRSRSRSRDRYDSGRNSRYRYSSRRRRSRSRSPGYGRSSNDSRNRRDNDRPSRDSKHSRTGGGNIHGPIGGSVIPQHSQK